MSKKNESFERFIGTSSTILNGANTGLSLTSTFLGNVNEAVEPFLPIIATITALTKDIAKVYENVQYNKNTCGVLVNRVEAAEAAIKGLMRQREENIDKFLSQGYNKSFEKYVVCLNNIKDFCESISQLSKVKKFFTSEKIRETFLAIIKEFDGCTADLNLAITTNTYKDLATLQSDMIEMKKFLDNVGGGITSIDDKTNEIISLNKQIIKMLQKEKSLDFTTVNEEINNIFLFNEKVNNQDLTLEVKRIMSSELKDARVTREGSRVTIRKKIYKEMDIACKPIVSMDNTQKIQKHLAILEKLNICPYIIQFHGLSKIAEENVMIFEWAEYGTLRELYLNLNKNNHNIKWGIKISIARDICRGLAFLHSVNILHHDLRCENILITENMQPKISNFGLAREFNAATHPIENFVDIIHWLAPEKLEYINRYTIQCEIFSFGMLLWELGFQQKPYENKSLTKILEHVLNGGREKLDIGLYSNSIKKEYCEIIRLAWEQEPSFRPEIRRLFNMLQDLYD
ncbi:kinase-like domain-containing protein, partial [Glomus cerebriforme]